MEGNCNNDDLLGNIVRLLVLRILKFILLGRLIFKFFFIFKRFFLIRISRREGRGSVGRF